MNNWLENIYLNPSKFSYQLLYKLNNHLPIWLIVLFFIINLYPAFHILNNHHQIQKEKLNNIALNRSLAQKRGLLESIKQHNKQKISQESSFTQVNNQIQNLLNQYGIQAETMQWGLGKENFLYLTINHQSKTIFKLLEAINKIEHLYPIDITLSKLEEKRLIQLNATFILTK